MNELRIEIDNGGLLTVTLDGTPYEPPGGPYPSGRESVRPIVDAARAELGTLSVRLVEADGSTYTDVLLPSDNQSAPTTDVEADGFLPGEQVAVAVILAEHPATSDGAAAIALPAAVVARHAGRLMLLGRTSGTLTVLGNGQ